MEDHGDLVSAIDLTPDEASQIITWYLGAPEMPTDEEDALVAKIHDVAHPEPRISVELTASDVERIMRWYGESTDLEDDDDQLQDDNLLTMLSVARKLAE